MEKLLFPKIDYRLTQGYGDNSYSHAGTYALDVAGKDKKIYAPFSGYVAKVYTNKTYGNTVWIVSSEKTLLANGDIKYVVMSITHPKEIESMKVNDTFKQWDYILNDGSTGISTGDHLHFEIAVYDNKKDIIANRYRTSKGTYGLINSVDPLRVMFLKNETNIINETYQNKKYHFIYENEKLYNLEKGTYKLLYNLNVRTGPSVKYDLKNYNDLSLDGKKISVNNEKAIFKKDSNLTILEIIYEDSFNIWGRTYNGYICLVSDNNIMAQKIVI